MNKIGNWWKYSGILLTATGVIHTIVGLVMGRDIYLDILKLGFINAIEPCRDVACRVSIRGVAA